MKKINSQIPHYIFEHFSDDVTQLVTCREGGVSKGEYTSLNFSFASGDEVENVKQNREILANSIGVKPSKLFFPVQTHTANVKIVQGNEPAEYFEETDALITNQKEIALAVMCADCVPILLHDPVEKVVAAVHAGWRGTVAKIVECTIQKMKSEFGSNPENIVAGIGPSIGSQSYEVDTPVAEAFQKAFDKDADKILTAKEETGKFNLDLWEANKIVLLQAGVHEAKIEIASICTFQNDVFFSARRQGFACGRFAGVVKLK